MRNYGLNHFKNQHINGKQVLWSLGEYAITDFVVQGCDMGEEKCIYIKLSDDYEYSIWDDHVYASSEGYFELIGFGDNLEDAKLKIDRILTGSEVNLIHYSKHICPRCGKEEIVMSYIEKYQWTRNKNSRSYSNLIPKIQCYNGVEYVQCRPSEFKTTCQQCWEEIDDLPF